MTNDFVEDSKIQQIAEAYALDTVDFAAKNFQISLDWSDSSVAQVEKILSIFHDQAVTAKPSEDQIFQFAKLFGSYVGEVFRRNHGAAWGMINLRGQTFPGLKADGSAGLFWPWGRAQQRLISGAENNIWHYYQVLLERNGSNMPDPPQPSSLASHQSWWGKLFGSKR